MTTTYRFSEARQKFSAILEEAERTGEVRIVRRNGRSFVIRPERSKRSPLDVKGIDTGVRTEEIVEVIREGRGRGYAEGEE